MKRRLLLLIIVISFCIGGVVSAQDDTVHAVLFYMPTCSHCHDLMQDHLPSIYATYGAQLDIAYIDLSQSGNRPIFLDACTVYDKQCSAVPTLIIGDHFIVGTDNIAERLPTIIEEGLANGGIPFRELSTLQSILDAPRVNPYAPVTVQTSMTTFDLGSFITAVLGALLSVMLGR